jgi:hypothetical protein
MAAALQTKLGVHKAVVWLCDPRPQSHIASIFTRPFQDTRLGVSKPLHPLFQRHGGNRLGVLLESMQLTVHVLTGARLMVSMKPTHWQVRGRTYMFTAQDQRHGLPLPP